MVNSNGMDRREFINNARTGVFGTILSYVLPRNSYAQSYPIGELPSVQTEHIFSKKFIEDINGLDESGMRQLFNYDDGDCKCYTISTHILDKTVAVYLQASSGEGNQSAIEPNQPLYIFSGDMEGNLEVLQDERLEGIVSRYWKTKLNGKDYISYQKDSLGLMESFYREITSENGRGLRTANLHERYKEELNRSFEELLNKLSFSFQERIADYIGVQPLIPILTPPPIPQSPISPK